MSCSLVLGHSERLPGALRGPIGRKNESLSLIYRVLQDQCSRLGKDSATNHASTVPSAMSGAVFQSFWAASLPSWDVWGHLPIILGLLRAILAILDPILGHSGPILAQFGLSWGISGLPWDLFGSSWGLVGTILRHLEAVSGFFGAFLASL